MQTNMLHILQTSHKRQIFLFVAIQSWAMRETKNRNLLFPRQLQLRRQRVLETLIREE